jgi:quercetin dioxygenase-like cupin family protein
MYSTPRFDVERFGSVGVVMDFLPAAGKGRNTRTHVARIAAGGTLGEHEATMRQVFAVVDGEAEVSTSRGPRQPLPAGRFVIWETGELHQTWAVTDVVVVIVETDAVLELPDHFRRVA